MFHLIQHSYSSVGQDRYRVLRQMKNNVECIGIFCTVSEDQSILNNSVCTGTVRNALVHILVESAKVVGLNNTLLAYYLMFTQNLTPHVYTLSILRSSFRVKGISTHLTP